MGTVVRSLGSYVWLALGTAVLGVAIGIGNVLVPALITGSFDGSTITSHNSSWAAASTSP